MDVHESPPRRDTSPSASLDSKADSTVAHSDSVKAKDIWDKVACLSGLTSAVLVAIIGGSFTYIYNERSRQQDAYTRAQQERLQELQVVVQLMPYLSGKDENGKRYAITAIQALGSATLAAEIAKLNPSEGAQEGLASIAANATRPTDRQVAESALRQIRCGIEDSEIKTLTDPEAPHVSMEPRRSTIRDLLSLPSPQGLASAAGRARLDPEKVTYAVRARLMMVRIVESRDYQLILADLDNPDDTLIGRIPAPECSTASPMQARFAEARAEIDHLVGGPPGSTYKASDRQIELEGVGYFARPHGVRSAAANGFELHPVIRVKSVGQ